MGRRGANQTAVVFAALGTLACGMSKNMETLIAARFVRDHPTYQAIVLTCYSLEVWVEVDWRPLQRMLLLTGYHSAFLNNTCNRIIASDMYSLRVGHGSFDWFISNV